ncbi:MAG: alpha/beta hydrolase-fold protein [Gemmatimonadota bacterium]|nr:alpha/beta hydrolase-fold protein [Gemmatimonadota bacterium]
MASSDQAATPRRGEVEGEGVAVEAPPGHTLTGDFRRHPKFRSRFLPSDHTLLVYRPPGYAEDRVRRFPVLYLHDGQNLFEGATAFVPGQDWRVSDTAEELIHAGVIEPLIIVGIYNTGIRRVDEYTPTRDRRQGAGGNAALYGRMLTEELKPFIDNRYRTLPDSTNTGLGGSSLGGLVTLYLGLQHPGVYGKLAVLSPSIWWDNRVILNLVRMTEPKPRLRIWLDIGTGEGGRHVRDARELRDELLKAGWVLGSDLVYAEIPEAGHNEAAWAARVGPFLQFLFPAREPHDPPRINP